MGRKGEDEGPSKFNEGERETAKAQNPNEFARRAISMERRRKRRIVLKFLGKEKGMRTALSIQKKKEKKRVGGLDNKGGHLHSRFRFRAPKGKRRKSGWRKKQKRGEKRREERRDENITKEGKGA